MRLRKLALFAPVVFIIHVCEEAPGFVAWFNSLVPRGITQSLFLTVNAAALVITVIIVLLVAASRDSDPVAGLALAAWAGFLMLANGLVHIVGTLAHARYCPGVVTGTLLYLPYGALLLRGIIRDARLNPVVVLTAAALGAIPMFVHGYLIVFRASRLF